MLLDSLIQALPPHARDVARGLTALEAETVLSAVQLWGVVLASAHAVGTRAVVEIAERAAAQAGLGETARAAARGAAAVMAQNNVYFRAIELIGDPVLEAEPSRLRMNTVHRPAVAAVDMHLMCLAVSAINGCGACMRSHVDALKALDARPPTLAAALRAAALIHAASRVLAANDGAPPLHGEGQPA
ncbi:carboxymuconolactone decarboxylase family protein [Caulobacter sp. KR2-114]|uniref:carboxymuconolactone decarboxylase family protein n=1 Tax=Caulobacter sp. KR2-114 TaxID=3400912 RepID=UPI003C0D4FC5